MEDYYTLYLLNNLKNKKIRLEVRKMQVMK